MLSKIIKFKVTYQIKLNNYAGYYIRQWFILNEGNIKGNTCSVS